MILFILLSTLHAAMPSTSSAAPVWTLENLLEYFPGVHSPEEVQWAHAANSLAELAAAVESDAHMVEADILLRGRVDGTRTPIMAHPPANDSDLTFQDFIQTMKSHPKMGLKLDFKVPDAVKPCLEMLRDADIRAPVMVNADLWKGPAGQEPVFDPSAFFKTVRELAPRAMLSVGWTTGKSVPKVLLGSSGYTTSMVREALTDLDRALADYPQQAPPGVTFPVHAVLAKQNQPAIKMLLHGNFTLTMWGDVEFAK